MTSQGLSTERIRVLFVLGTMEAGGAQRQVIELLRRLDRSRFEPFLYLAVKKGEFLGDIPSDVPVLAFWDGSPETLVRKVCRWFRLTRLIRYLSLANVLREKRIDVIYDRTFLSTIDAAGACWLRPTPRLSCCVVDPEPELNAHARFSRRLSYKIARWAYASATLALTNSEGLRQRLITYFSLDPGHVRTCRNILVAQDQQEVEQSGDEATALNNAIIHRSEGVPFQIVIAGRLHPQKGHRYLLEAVDRLVHQQGKSLRLMILGDGELKKELQQCVSSHHLESVVEFAGFVTDPRPWYEQANLFVLPSLYEGSPNALVEAMACGVPALAADCPSGPSEILDEGRCGRLVPPGDTDALVIAIADAIEHEQEWRQRAILARQWIRTLFDPDEGMKQFENLLVECSGHIRAIN